MTKETKTRNQPITSSYRLSNTVTPPIDQKGCKIVLTCNILTNSYRLYTKYITHHIFQKAKREFLIKD